MLAYDASRTRRFLRPARISAAASLTEGAMTISVKYSAISAAVSASSSAFRAITPPKADTGSQSHAARNAPAGVSDSAEPQGLVDLFQRRFYLPDPAALLILVAAAESEG